MDREPQINNSIISRWDKIKIRDAAKGDHVRSYAAGVPDSIVEGRDTERRKLKLISCSPVGRTSIVKRYEIDLHGNELLDKAIYPSCSDSHSTVQRAQSKVGTSKDRQYVTHPSSFAMWCKMGRNLDWKEIYISNLSPGQHIKFSQRNQHGIVETINLDRVKVQFITYNGNTGIVERQVSKGVNKFKIAVHNICCNEHTSLAIAQECLQLKKEDCHYQNDGEFARYCRSGKSSKEEEIGIEEPTVYPPRSRDINTQVQPEWRKRRIDNIVKGDHIKEIKDKDVALSHCIVEKVERGGRKLTLIGCVEETDRLIIQGNTISLTGTPAVEVAVYSSSQNSAQVVDYAKDLMKKMKDRSFEGSELEFAVLCKRGSWVSWETAFIGDLRRGDHIKIGCQHALVDSVDRSSSQIACIKYSAHLSGKWKAENVSIRGKRKMWRAVYNSAFDVETVMRLAYSRLNEKEYHLFNNNSETFAKWCKTGIADGRTTHKTLIISADMLRPGDQISWTRVWTYDHHAIVKEVIGPNLIVVYEFTVNKNSKSRAKTFKTETEMPIFDGDDPPYKVTHTPADDPQVLLKEAARQVGKEGGYHPLKNNCENFAGMNTKFENQARGFFKFLAELATKCTTKQGSTNLGGMIDDAVSAAVKSYGATFGTSVAGDASAAIRNGLLQCARVLHTVGFFAPLVIEIGLILWDINHDWADHKKTRFITGMAGAALTSLVITGLALPVVPIGLSVLLAFVGLLIGILGSALTTFAMRSIRRLSDRNKCRKAFAGLYEEKPGIVDKLQAALERLCQILKSHTVKIESALSQIVKSNPHLRSSIDRVAGVTVNT